LQVDDSLTTSTTSRSATRIPTIIAMISSLTSLMSDGVRCRCVRALTSCPSGAAGTTTFESCASQEAFFATRAEMRCSRRFTFARSVASSSIHGLSGWSGGARIGTTSGYFSSDGPAKVLGWVRTFFFLFAFMLPWYLPGRGHRHSLSLMAWGTTALDWSCGATPPCGLSVTVQ
jgi:hypothetical protein